MSELTALSWQIVALMFGGMLIWRLDAWVHKKWGRDALMAGLNALEPRLFAAETSMAELLQRMEKLEKLTINATPRATRPAPNIDAFK